jgi:hypothetical protein
MISRSAFAQLNHSAALLLGTICGMAVIYIVPVLALVSGKKLAIGFGAAAWALNAAIFMPTVREYRVPRWIAFCLPGIAVFYLAATVESAARYWAGRGGEWKGRAQDSL